MRPALLAGLASLVLAAAAAAQTPSGPYLATVADAGTKLRAGPSDKFPETATLPKGFQVVVDHDEDGWLAVQDAPGRVTAFSWVQTQFIKFEEGGPLSQLAEVEEDGTTLRAGQLGLAQPLPVQKAKVPGGTILTVIGKGVKFEGKTWYPVVPPPGDFRYLPKQAVAYDRPAAGAFTVRDSVPEKSLPPAVTAGGAGTAPAGAATSVLSPPAGGGAQGTPAGRSVQNPLWAQAEAAERDGRLDDAEKLYFQLARAMNEPGGDHDIANLCYTRIHAIRERKRTGAPYPSAVPPAAPPSPSNSPTRPTSLPPERPAPVTGLPPAPAGSAEPKAEGGKWTGPGRLVRSALAIDGRRTYALESSPGVVSVYVVAGQGVDLERFANKKVDVYGVSSSRRDLSKPFVVASAAESVQ